MATRHLSAPATITDGPTVVRSDPSMDASVEARHLHSRIGDEAASKITANTPVSDQYTPEMIAHRGESFLKTVLARIAFANIIRDTATDWAKRNAQDPDQMSKIMSSKDAQDLFTANELAKHPRPVMDAALTYLKDMHKQWLSQAPAPTAGLVQPESMLQSRTIPQPISISTGPSIASPMMDSVPMANCRPSSSIRTPSGQMAPLQPVYNPPQQTGIQQRRVASAPFTQPSSVQNSPMPDRAILRQVQQMQRVPSNNQQMTMLPQPPVQHGPSPHAQPYYPEQNADTVHGQMLRTQLQGAPGMPFIFAPHGIQVPVFSAHGAFFPPMPHMQPPMPPPPMGNMQGPMMLFSGPFPPQYPSQEHFERMQQDERRRSFKGNHGGHKGNAGQWKWTSPAKRISSIGDQSPDIANEVPLSHLVTADFIGPDVENVYTLWVHNLPPSATSEIVHQFLESNANVAVAKVDAIKFDKNRIAYTYVTFHSTHDARKALALDGSALGDRNLRIRVKNNNFNPAVPYSPNKVPYNAARLRRSSTLATEHNAAYSPQDARSGTNNRRSSNLPDEAKPTDSSDASPTKKNKKGKKKLIMRRGTGTDTTSPVDTEPEPPGSPQKKTNNLTEANAGDEPDASTQTESGGARGNTTTSTKSAFDIVAEASGSPQTKNKDLTEADVTVELENKKDGGTCHDILPVTKSAWGTEAEASGSPDLKNQDSAVTNVTIEPGASTQTFCVAEAGTQTGIGATSPMLHPVGANTQPEAKVPEQHLLRELPKTSSETLAQQMTAAINTADDTTPIPTPDIPPAPASPTGGLPTPTPLADSNPFEIDPPGPELPHEQVHGAKENVDPPIPAVNLERSHVSPLSAVRASGEPPEPFPHFETARAAPPGDDGHTDVTSQNIATNVEVSGTLAVAPEVESFSKGATLAPISEANELVAETFSVATENESNHLPLNSLPGVAKTPRKRLGPAQTESLNPFAAMKKVKKAEAEAKKKEKKKVRAPSGTKSSFGDATNRVASSASSSATSDYVAAERDRSTGLLKGGLGDITNRNAASSRTAPMSKEAVKSPDKADRTENQPFLGEAEAGEVVGEPTEEPQSQISAIEQESKVTSPKKSFMSNLFNFDFGRTKAPSLMSSQTEPQNIMVLGPNAVLHTPSHRDVSSLSEASNPDTGDSLNSVQSVTEAAPGAYPSTIKRRKKHKNNGKHEPERPLSRFGDGNRKPSPPLKSEVEEPPSSPTELSIVGDTRGSRPIVSMAPLIQKAAARKASGIIEAPISRGSMRKRRIPKPLTSSTSLELISATDSSSPSTTYVSESSSINELETAKQRAKLKLFQVFTEQEFLAQLERHLSFEERQVAVNIAVELGKFRGWREENMSVQQPYTLALIQYSSDESRQYLKKAIDGEVKRFGQEASFANLRQHQEVQQQAQQMVKAKLKSIKRGEGSIMSEADLQREAQHEVLMMENIRTEQREQKERIDHFRTVLNMVQVATGPNQPQIWMMDEPQPTVSETLPAGEYRGLGLGEEVLPLPKHGLPLRSGYIEEVEEDESGQPDRAHMAKDGHAENEETDDNINRTEIHKEAEDGTATSETLSVDFVERIDSPQPGNDEYSPLKAELEAGDALLALSRKGIEPIKTSRTSFGEDVARNSVIQGVLHDWTGWMGDRTDYGTLKGITMDPALIMDTYLAMRRDLWAWEQRRFFYSMVASVAAIRAAVKAAKRSAWEKQKPYDTLTSSRTGCKLPSL